MEHVHKRKQFVLPPLTKEPKLCKVPFTVPAEREVSPKPMPSIDQYMDMMEEECRRTSEEAYYWRGEIAGDTFITEVDEPHGDIEDSDYDTDLETEVKPRAVTEKRKRRAVYRRVCSEAGLTPISYCIRNMENVEFTLKHRGLAEREAEALALPLQVIQNTESLDLEGNWLGPEGMVHFSYLLRDSSALTKVNLSHNRLGNKGAKALRWCMVANTTVEELNLAGNCFTDKDAPLIGDVIQRNTTLKKLDLSHNDFNSDGAVILGPAIGENMTLEELDLSWNQIRLKGCESIGAGIAENKKLKKLNLAMNGFAMYGSISVADALMISNNMLEELDLSNNRIPMAAASLFGKAFTHNYALRILKMNSNPVTSAGALDLIRDIEESTVTNLERLELRDVTVNDDFMDSVEAIKEIRHFECEVGYVSTAHQMARPNIFKFNALNPLEIMLVHMEQKRLRLVDMFRDLDKDGSGGVDKKEFINGLKTVDTPLSSAQMDELIDMLDKDGDGEVDLREIMNIDAEFKTVRRKAKKQVKRQRRSEGKGKRVDYRTVGLMAIIKARQKVDNL